MSQYAHPEVLVDTQWLMDHLHDPLVRIIEVGMNPDSHKDSHIPGAIFWHVFADLLQPNHSMNLDPAAIAKLLSRSGITPETTVVAYGSDPSAGAWIFWLLKLFGHEKIFVLNGGHKKWMAEKRPVTSEFSTFDPTQYPEKTVDNNLRVLQNEVQASLNQPDCILLDVRTPAEYCGEMYLMQPPTEDERAGHIPGAIHLEHTLTLNEDSTFKSATKLKNLYDSRGITAEKTVFPYCAIGARSAYTWFVLKYLLGYPKVRNYDGSWNEWSRLPSAPVEK